MPFISKVYIKDNVSPDTEIVINKYSGEVVDINALLASIPIGRGIATYSALNNKAIFNFEAIGANEMWVEYDGIIAKSSSVNLSSKILTGSGVPSGSLGYVQDLYINSANSDVYEKTGISTWTLKLNIRGTTGATGATGKSIVSLPTDPTNGIENTTNIGDLYLNSTTGNLFERSNMTQSQFFSSGLSGLVLASSIWLSKGNIKGATGLQGIQGGIGATGATGGIYPSVGSVTTQHLFWKLDYKLDENDATSNGNFLFIEVEGFAGTNNKPFKMHGMYLQEDGLFTFLKTAMIIDIADNTVACQFQVNDLNEVFIRVSSLQNGIKAICKAYVQNVAVTNKMKDAVLGFESSQPNNIVGTYILSNTLL